MKRRFTQIIFFAIFAFFLGRFVLENASGITAAISPTLQIGNFLSFNSISFLWLIPAGLILLLSLWNGRFFCWNVCPVGFIQDVLPSINKLKSDIRGLNVAFFLFLLGASLLFLNLVGILDPIVIFARAVNVFKKPFYFLGLWFFVPLAVILILNFFGKKFWCFNLCPLGTFAEGAKKLRLYLVNKQKAEVDISKRTAIATIGGGLVAGALLNLARSSYADERLIRPPGAKPERIFKETCVRCGNCVKACITNGLQPCVTESGWDGVFTPRLVPRLGECDEYCNRCGFSCPTGAIKPLKLSVKRNVRMGLARVNRSTCIAWSRGELCMVCSEFCPYLAVGSAENNGVPCPVVKADACRGCGHCEKNCPAPGVAIRTYRIAIH